MTRPSRGYALAVVVAALLALSVIVAVVFMPAPVFGADPAPQTVESAVTVTLDSGVAFTGDYQSPKINARDYGVVDVFVDIDLDTSKARSLTPKIQISPDGVLWFDSVSLTALTADGGEYVRTTVYGEYIRVTYTVSDTTVPYTPTAIITLKNN